MKAGGAGPVQARAITSHGHNWILFQGRKGEEGFWLYMPPGSALVGWGYAFQQCCHQVFRERGAASARGVATWRGEGELGVSADWAGWGGGAGEAGGAPPVRPTNVVCIGWGVGRPIQPGQVLNPTGTGGFTAGPVNVWTDAEEGCKACGRFKGEQVPCGANWKSGPLVHFRGHHWARGALHPPV